MTTRVSPAFEWIETAAGRTLHCAALDPYADHVFTTRPLAFRGPNAEDDYRRLGEVLGVSSGDIVRVRQVHGRRVLVVRPGDRLEGQANADAIVLADPARAATVGVADCVPILLADRRRRVAAAVHAGWRGTSAGVATAAVEAVAELGVPAADLVAAIGPSIGPCCYQVDDRVRNTLLAMTPDAAAWFTEDGPGHWKLDLWQANADELERAGVPAHAIFVARLCTADDPAHWFSYRREGAAVGRTVGAIKLKGAGDFLLATPR